MSPSHRSAVSVHVRRRRCSPPPQVVLHADHSDHDRQPKDDDIASVATICAALQGAAILHDPMFIARLTACGVKQSAAIGVNFRGMGHWARSPDTCNLIAGQCPSNWPRLLTYFR